MAKKASCVCVGAAGGAESGGGCVRGVFDFSGSSDFPGSCEDFTVSGGAAEFFVVPIVCI